MSNTETIPAQFYIQWHATGREQGAWRASDGSADRQFFDRWRLASADTAYTFSFDSQQGAGHPYTVFATLNDSGSDKLLGVRIEPNKPASETVLALTVAGDELLFSAGELLSDDPKLTISTGKPPATVSLIWSANGDGVFSWTYTDGTSRDPIPYAGEPIEIGPDATGAVSITILDQSPGAANHTCAVYYGTRARGETGPTNIGTVGTTEAVAEDGEVELRFVPEQDQFTINLFTSLQTNKSTILVRR